MGKKRPEPAGELQPEHDMLEEQRRDLEFAAFKALSGADYVRLRLLHGLSMGNPSLELEAYLIKSRVKSVDSLMMKVLDRRLTDPAYSPNNARDIVGLRLLTLFKNDLPSLVMRFLEFVEWSRSEPFSLFYGNNINDTFAEVKIYATSDIHDPNPALCMEVFQLHGFKIKPGLHGGPGIEVIRKPSQYSSVHIVLWANGPRRSSQDKVPVEVQLRTSLEDVWGEIDHRLRYKARARALNAGERDYDDDSLDEVVSSDLKALKKALDACSEVADNIEERLKSEEPIVEAIRQSEAFVSYDFDQLDTLELKPELRGKVKKIVARLRSAYDDVNSLRSKLEEGVIDRSLRSFEIAVRDLKVVLDKYREHQEPDTKVSDDIQYRFMMERALAFFWRAVLLKTKSAMGEATGKSDGLARDALRSSISQYLAIGRLDGFSTDPVLAFRLAHVLALRQEEDTSLMKYREAVDFLEEDTRLSPNHYLRVRIPRQYGVALWDAAERSKRKAIELGEEKLSVSRRRDLYLDAIAVTKPIHGREIDEGGEARDKNISADDSRVSANNIVEYVLCYLRSGGTWEELAKKQLSKQEFDAYLRELLGNGLESITRPTLADTIREVARWQGKRELAVAAARKVLELIEIRDFSMTLPDIAFDEMRRDAEQELADGLNPVLGYSEI